MIFMLEYKKITWWYWLLSALCVSAGVFGQPIGFYFLIVSCFVQLVHFGVEDKTIQSFTVQLRLVMLGMAILFYYEPLRVLYWIPFCGLWANTLFGYCLLVRIMALMPWNRNEPLSLSLVRRVIFSPPVKGNFLDYTFQQRGGS